MAWLTGWSHRKAVTITGQSGAGTDYQVKLSIGDSAGGDFHLEGNCTNFPQDIIVTDNDGTTLLDHWVEDLTVDPITLWVEVADDLGSNVDVYIYYRKSGETSASSIGNTFLVGDDWHDNKYSSRDDGLPEWTKVSGDNPIASASFFDFPAENSDQVYKTTWNGLTSFVVEFKAKQADNVFNSGSASLLLYKDATHYYYWNWSQTDDFDFIMYSTPLIENTYTKDTSWHNIKVTRKSNSEWEIFLDGVSKGTVTNADFTDWTEIRLFKNDWDRRQNWDDLRIRKFLSPTEPAFSTAGSEENPPAAYTYGSRRVYSILF